MSRFVPLPGSTRQPLAGFAICGSGRQVRDHECNGPSSFRGDPSELAISNTTQGYNAGPGWDACTGLGTPTAWAS